MNRLRAALALAVALMMLSGCAKAEDTSGDAEYEAATIAVECPGEKDVKLSIAQLRELEQHSLDASYQRTTGLYEEFKIKGPYVSDVLKLAGIDIGSYEGIGVSGTDGYYCLLPREVIEATPDLMLAIVIDGNAKLDDIDAPARLAVQGQFGPYWVRSVSKLTLYEEIPEKRITSVWSFKNLSSGIEPYAYEYYGSKDDAIELEQIFSRLNNVDSKAFFTMKSSDGFKKNEILNVVKSRYYIKTEGEDAPTNISPYIKLGMNVKNISWISTNADAAIFPKKLEEYIETKTIGEYTGLPLSEIMYEVEVQKLKGETFDILGTNGEKLTVPGEDLGLGILAVTSDGRHMVVWDDGAGYENIADMMRIRQHEH